MQRKSCNSVKVFSAPSRDDIIRRLRAGVERLRKVLPLSAVYLIGSYASGRYAPGSDVDVLVVYRGRGKKEAYDRAWDALDVPNLELHIYSQREFEDLMKREPSPLKAMLGDAIPILKED